MTNIKRKLYDAINRYGAKIISEKNQNLSMTGIFGSVGELIPSLLPFRQSTEEQIVMYVKNEDAARYGTPELSLCAGKKWLVSALDSVYTHDETLFTQYLLTRYIEPVVEEPEPEAPQPDPVYPISLTFGGNALLMTVKKAVIKQGSLVVNIGAVNKFVSDQIAGSKAITAEITALASKAQAATLASQLKDAATAVPKLLKIDSMLSVHAVISDYSFEKSESDDNVTVKIIFTEIRSV